MERKSAEIPSSVSADLNDLECSIDENNKGSVEFYCRLCKCHLYSSLSAVDHLCSKEHLVIKGNNGRKTVAKRVVKGMGSNLRASFVYVM